MEWSTSNNRQKKFHFNCTTFQGLQIHSLSMLYINYNNGSINNNLFLYSGLLLSYNFLRNQGNISLIRQNTLWQNFKFFTKQILHRYLRFENVFSSLVLYQIF